MPFEPGNSGNPNGRPKGAGNKQNEKLRSLINSFLEEKFDTIKTEFDKLPAKDKARLFCDLLQYAVPKMQAISGSVNWEDLSDEQLDEIINRLKGQE